MPNAHWTRYQKWSVFWYNKKKGKYVRKRFYEDIASAIKFYTEHQDRPGITLHVDNHGYPPPLRITEHERVKWIVVKRKGKRYKKKVTEIVNLMDEYNLKGIWWCPYCIKLRSFTVIESDEGMEAHCPVCTASHRIVKQYNPKAIDLEFRKTRRKQSGPRRRRRR
jgi:rubrerythrin